jgi:hypothetical protein
MTVTLSAGQLERLDAAIHLTFPSQQEFKAVVLDVIKQAGLEK